MRSTMRSSSFLLLLLLVCLFSSSSFVFARRPALHRTRPTHNNNNDQIKQTDIITPTTPSDTNGDACLPCYTGILCSQCAEGCVAASSSDSTCVPLAAATTRNDEHQQQQQHHEDDVQTQFDQFLHTYNKSYSTTKEYLSRREVFRSNLIKIVSHNQRRLSYTLAVNEFADLTHAEFQTRMFGPLKTKVHNMTQHTRRATIDRTAFDLARIKAGFRPAATALDWRTKNAVTPVKNQLSCGCDYAFAAIGAIEGANAIKTNHLVSLSEQQIVDCSESVGNQGCHGGGVDVSFKYVTTNGGIASEIDYPYTSSDDNTCQTATPTSGTVNGFVDVPADEESLMDAVNIGPVAVYVDSSNEAFQFYSLGILDDPTCGTSANHAMVVVGYGTDAKLGTNYWILKNSWGAGWGQQGFAQFARNVNQCGITTRMSYPTV